MGGFRCILADPPWQMWSRGSPCRPDKSPNTILVEHYYPTMSLDEIKALPVASVAAKASVLFLWATVPMLPDAFEVMRTWGWEYKTTLTWHKTNRDCLGYWFRICTEHLLVGIRGPVRSFRSMTRTLFESKRVGHSRKPEASYAIIEAVTPEPRLELFARAKRSGWHSWGNEVESDIQLTRWIET